LTTEIYAKRIEFTNFAALREKKQTHYIMVSPEGLKLIDKVLKDIDRNGIVTNTIVADLQKLRPFAIEEEDPSLTKVIRLTYEHIEENKGFNIPIPEDEEIEEGVELVKIELTEATKVESLTYLVSLMKDAMKASNRTDLLEYRDALMDF